MASCVLHNDRQPSLSIIDGKNGAVVTCFAGCDWRDIRAELRQRGLLDSEPVHKRQPPKIAFTGLHKARRTQQHSKATWIWSQRLPPEGTIVERYLRKARGYAGSFPKTIGFLAPKKVTQHPAMIAAYSLVDEPEPGVVGLPRDVDAVHLTLLRPDGSDKADVEHSKISVGSPRQRPIVLALPNDLFGLTITEGIEDALTAHLATGLGSWAAGSASYMPALANVVPNYIEAVTIYAHDDGGRPFALKLAETLYLRGIEVRLEGLAT